MVVNSVISGRNPPLYCTLTVIAMQRHQIKTKAKDTMTLDYSSICCVAIPFVLDVGLVDAPGFLHLPSAVLALIFIAEGFSRQPSLFSLVDRELQYNISNFVYPRNNRSPLLDLLGMT